jgi:hypothetical protein
LATNKIIADGLAADKQQLDKQQQEFAQLKNEQAPAIAEQQAELERQKLELILLRGVGYGSGSFQKNTMSEKQRRTMLTYYGKEWDTMDVLVGLDFTVWGSADNHLLFTRDVVYFGSDNKYDKLRYADISPNSARIEAGSLRLNNKRITVIDTKLNDQKILATLQSLANASPPASH